MGWKVIANLWMGFDDRARILATTPDEKGNPHWVNQAVGDVIVQDIFKMHDPNGPRTFKLWSLYYDVETEVELRDIRNDLNADFPGMLRTIGSWWWNGEQVMNSAGTQPLFPLHTTILEYMPDVWNGDDPPTYSPATSLADVNLGMGQATRNFT